MAQLDIGGVGVNLYVRGLRERLTSVVPQVEDLGYDTIWLSGGGIDSTDDIRSVVRAGREITVGSGILPVVAYDSASARELFEDLESSDPGRFVLGLGGAHGPRPVAVLGSYLDDLEGSVPVDRRALAAMGPRMLELARDRTAAAYPFLVTPEYVETARSTLGSETTLVVLQLLVLEPDLERARAIARDQIAGMSSIPPYAASLRRMGFTEDDIARTSDRLVDGVAVLGGPDEVAARVEALRRAGADQVVLAVGGTDDPAPAWRTLARRLIP